jgi:Flp pilus assembly protein TadD
MKKLSFSITANTIHTLRELVRIPGGAELLVAATALIAYLCTTAFGFVYDDRMTLSAMPQLPSLHDFLSVFLPNSHPGKDDWIVAYYYRPMLSALLLFCRLLFRGWAAGWHLVGVTLHVAASLMVYRLGLLLWRRRNIGFVAALLFAAHPVHLQTVVWVSGYSDLLAGFFLLASVLCFLRWAEGGRPLWQLPALLLGGMALLSKETAVALPFLLFFTAIAVETRRPRRRILLATLPSLLMTLLYLAARFSAIRALQNSPSDALPGAPIVYSYPQAAWFYLRQLLATMPVSPVYPLGPVQSPGFLAFWLPLLLCLLTFLLLALWWYLAGRRREPLACAVWILLPMPPAFYAMSSFVAGQMASERYLYAPSVGFCLLAAALLCRIVPGWAGHWGRIQGQLVAGIAVTFLLMASTVFQQQYWANDIFLFHHALQVSPGDQTALLDLGTAYYEKENYEAGDEQLRKLLFENPNHPSANFNYGISLFRRGNYAEADAPLRRCVILNPDNMDGWIYLAMNETRMGHLDLAVFMTRQALARHPGDPRLMNTQGAILLMEGSNGAAMALFQKVLAANPADETAQQGLQQSRQQSPH